MEKQGRLRRALYSYCGREVSYHNRLWLSAEHS